MTLERWETYGIHVREVFTRHRKNEGMSSAFPSFEGERSLTNAHLNVNDIISYLSGILVRSVSHHVFGLFPHPFIKSCDDCSNMFGGLIDWSVGCKLLEAKHLERNPFWKTCHSSRMIYFLCLFLPFATRLRRLGSPRRIPVLVWTSYSEQHKAEETPKHCANLIGNRRHDVKHSDPSDLCDSHFFKIDYFKHLSNVIKMDWQPGELLSVRQWGESVFDFSWEESFTSPAVLLISGRRLSSAPPSKGS